MLIVGINNKTKSVNRILFMIISPYTALHPLVGHPL